MKQSLTYRIIVTVVLSVISIMMLYPVYNMVAQAFMTAEELKAIPSPWFPSGLNWDSFKQIPESFGLKPDGSLWLWNFLGNTTFLLFAQTFGVIMSSTLCAYGFSKVKFVGREKCFFLLLCTIMIPSSVCQIPLFVLFKNFGWLNTLTPLWFPAWFGGGVSNIFLIRQFMKTIPDSLMESAELDGAGVFRRYWSIALPMSKPMIFYIFIGTFGGIWGDFFGPMIYVSDRDKWTFGLAVKNLVNDTNVTSVGNLNVQMAICVCMSLLPLFTFIIGQKNYIENVHFGGALKG